MPQLMTIKTYSSSQSSA